MVNPHCLSAVSLPVFEDAVPQRTRSLMCKRSLYGSVAATRADDHVTIFLEDDVWVVVEVKDGDGWELGRRAARLRYGQRLHQVSQRLDNGVVSGVHLGVQRERAFAVAVECRVTFRRNDPVLQRTVVPWLHTQLYFTKMVVQKKYIDSIEDTNIT